MAFICLWVVFLFQALVSPKKAKGQEDIDFRDVVKCRKVKNSFRGLTCLKEEPLGRGAKSLAFLVEFKGQKRVLLIQKKNATEAMLIREQLGEHPSIIHIDRFKPTKNWSFYVMEWGEQGSLSDFRKSHKNLFKNMTFALEFLRKVVEGTLHISQKGFVHSDLKLANIVVDAHLHPKIIDFELATRKDRQYHWRGTTSYMAPEVLRASKKDTKIFYSEKVDVYAIGVLFFRMLFGDYPYAERDKTYLYADIRDEVYFLPEGFDLEVAKLFAGCLKFKRRERFNLEQTLQQIDQAISAEGRKKLWKYEALGTIGPHFFLEERPVPLLERPTPLTLLAVSWLLAGLVQKAWDNRVGPYRSE